MLFANMIAIPWIGFLVVPLSLLACVSMVINAHLSHWLFIAAAKTLKPLWLLLQWITQLPSIIWFHAIPNVLILFVSCVALLLLLLPSGLPGRVLGLLWLLPLFSYCHPSPDIKSVWLTLLDVGQGLAAVVQTTHHVLVYDTGPSYPGGFNAGSAVVLPYLRHQGIHKIDTLMISHGDNDHIGGAKAILNALSVQEIITSVPNRFKNYTAISCVKGQRWQWDGVSFQILSPEKLQKYKGNNSSCVLRISNLHGAIILPGDIQKQVEKYLLKHEKQLLHAKVLIAPHHGSLSSSTVGFVKAVSPRYVLYPVGYYNRFGFPKAAIVARYKTHYAQNITTSQSGAITIRLSPQGRVRLSSFYQNNYYWQK